MNEATLRFVRQHADDDVKMLALRGSSEPDVDMAMALQQIAGLQTARRKLPTWYNLNRSALNSQLRTPVGNSQLSTLNSQLENTSQLSTQSVLSFPPHLAMEQCSSEQAARYKAKVVASLLSPTPSVSTLIDLTGGFGVDFSFLAPLFSRAVYVERQEELCRLARHNFQVLGLTGAEVVCADGPTYLRSLSSSPVSSCPSPVSSCPSPVSSSSSPVPSSPSPFPVSRGFASASPTVIFLDPARRDDHGSRTYGIADCTPDVLQLLPELLSKATYVVLKLSPMLDWRKTVLDLGPDSVRQVHLVSVGGECKELLVVLSQHGMPQGEGLQIVCENDGEQFVVTPTPQTPTPQEPTPQTPTPQEPTPQTPTPNPSRGEGSLYTSESSKGNTSMGTIGNTSVGTIGNTSMGTIGNTSVGTNGSSKSDQAPLPSGGVGGGFASVGTNGSSKSNQAPLPSGGAGGGFLGTGSLGVGVGLYLYEPNASVMKAGLFDLLCQRFGVSQLAPNSHLFVSEKRLPLKDGEAGSRFPGRGFLIERATTMNKHQLRQALQGIRKANITVRNFPLTAVELRKRLKLSDGGDTYILATTLADGTHLLLVCSRLNH